MVLDQLQPGESAVINRTLGDSNEASHLLEMGLIDGTTVRLVKTAPLGDPLQICVRGYHLSLRRREARLIEVSR
jgi:Fe2+ transport system protein FeoA